MRVFAGVLILLPVVAACQSVVPIEKAKQVTMSLSSPAFVPPPRTIGDIVAVLDEHRQDEPARVTEGRVRADQPPPDSGTSIALARFYWQRGRAARGVGCVDQEIADLTKAAEYAAAAGNSDMAARILLDLSNAATAGGGSFAATVGYLEDAARKVSPERRGLVVLIESLLARRYAQRGYQAQAESALRTAIAVREEAVSGLGHAFFYAGARALLVSHWAVETTSARALTSDLFRRQAADGRLTRTRAVQQTMLGLIERGALVDATTTQVVFSYAHPIFWAPFALVGDGGGAAR